MCRVRNCHSTEPWTTAYICITLDDSCLDEDGHYIDKPMTVRMVQWQPYCVTKNFGPKTPVCAACKRTNRTRSFCRERHKHRHLPWCTVYVLLSSLEAADPSTVVAGASKPVEAKEGEKTDENKKDEEAKADKPAKKVADDNDTIASDNTGHGDDINEIPESRTFLAKVNCRNTSIHWLELSDFDASESASFPAADPQHFHVGLPPGVDPAHAAYYGHGGMGYAAQQHQNDLKSRQQYFFQMHHSQHFGQQQWPVPPAHLYGAHTGEAPGATAGEAAAARTAAAGAQQWPMYFPQAAYPPQQQPQQQQESSQEQYAEGNTAEGDGEEPELKRQRV